VSKAHRRPQFLDAKAYCKCRRHRGRTLCPSRNTGNHPCRTSKAAHMHIRCDDRRTETQALGHSRRLSVHSLCLLKTASPPSSDTERNHTSSRTPTRCVRTETAPLYSPCCEAGRKFVHLVRRAGVVLAVGRARLTGGARAAKRSIRGRGALRRRCRPPDVLVQPTGATPRRHLITFDSFKARVLQQPLHR